MQTNTNFIKKYFLEFVILILLLVMYCSTFISWVNEWLNQDSFYSYGLFLPFFLYFFYKSRFLKIRNTSKSSSLFGLVILIVSSLLYVVGVRIDYYLFLNLSFVGICSGILLALYGYNSLKLNIVPIFMLVLSIPLLPIIRITIPLQLFFAKAIAILLAHLGVKVVSIGSEVYMGGYAISIAPGCTGLRSLLNLTFLAIMFSFFFNASTLKKSLFVLVTLPLTFLSNMLRIMFCGFYIIYNGYQGFESFHFVLGLVLYVIGIFAMYIISKLIEVQS